MFKKCLWRVFVVMSLILGSLLTVKPVHALGTPQIISIDPSSGPAGTSFNVHATVTWDDNFRAIRMCFVSGSDCRESGAPDITGTFGTNGLAPGNYYITVQVAGKDDNDWANPTSASGTFQVTETQQQPNNPPPQNDPPSNPSISCSADSFDVWPRSASVGDTIHISGSGSCNVGVRAIKVLIDGQDPHEFGGPSNEWSWNTSGYSAGSHKLKLWVAGQGDNNWDYAGTSSNITVQLNAPGQSAPAPDTSIPFDNCGVIGLNNGKIFVVTTKDEFEKHHVPNPETLDALGIPRAWIDNKGWSNSELESIHKGSDIPDVNVDPSGFAAFKAKCFPNTTPITPGGSSQNQQPEQLGTGPNLAPPQGPQGTIGNCPASPTMIEPGDIAIVTGFSQKELRIRNGPSTSNKIIGGIPKYERFTIIAGPVCADDIRWYEVGYGGVDGWSAEVAFDGEYNMVPNDYVPQGQSTDQQYPDPAASAATAIPQVGSYDEQVQPDQVFQELAVPDSPPLQGFDLVVDLITKFLGGDSVLADKVRCEPQCVNTARDKRPDMAKWIPATGNTTPEKILIKALSSPTFPWQDQTMQVRVRDLSSPKDQPQAGDLVIWPENVLKNGTGHIGVVTTTGFHDSNWKGDCQPRDLPLPSPLPKYLKFVTSPYPIDKCAKPVGWDILMCSLPWNK